MIDRDIVLRRAEKNLNSAVSDYERRGSTLAMEFQELKLQACIFQYDICAEMTNLARNRPTGFASSVALKGLVLRLYEYDLILGKYLHRRLLDLATKRGIPIDREQLKEYKMQWRKELKRYPEWSDIRNEAAAHYGKDLARQVQLLKRLNVHDVLNVAQAFIKYNMSVLRLLRDAGRGPDAI